MNGEAQQPHEAAGSAKIEPFLLAVLSHRLEAISREMVNTLVLLVSFVLIFSASGSSLHEKNGSPTC